LQGLFTQNSGSAFQEAVVFLEEGKKKKNYESGTAGVTAVVQSTANFGAHYQYCPQQPSSGSSRQQ